ncbi:MAG: hypothetical protein H0X25_00895 [Acidobacteriales bacterium]|nr:hypothetical protein [Terriglobales bacterium]
MKSVFSFPHIKRTLGKNLEMRMRFLPSIPLLFLSVSIADAQSLPPQAAGGATGFVYVLSNQSAAIQ